MAKLSLWLLTLAKDKPFEFLDHAIRCGDSLVGIHSLRQLERFNLDPDVLQAVWYTGPITKMVDEAVVLRQKLEAMPSNSVEDVEVQEKLLAEAEEKTTRLRYAADLLLSVEFHGGSPADKQSLHDSMAIQAGHCVENGTIEAFREAVRKALKGQLTFHWPLEFPEVFQKRGGFDAFVGNPPFMGGLKLESELGREFRAYIVEHLANNRRGIRGTADLCAYFFLRCSQAVRENGVFGLVATNTIAQGDTHEVGLAQLADLGYSIVRAHKSMAWPGDATIEISKVWMRRGAWAGTTALDDIVVSGIATHLTELLSVAGQPEALIGNQNQCFIGSYVLGMGFTMSRQEAEALAAEDSRNTDVLFPYINGSEFNSSPHQAEGRWIINFFDWSLEKAATYPRCMEIVREKVKPEREKIVGRNEMSTRRGTMWWRYAGEAKYLYQAIAGLSRVLARSRVSNINSIAFLPTQMVFSDALVVFAFEDYPHFGVLQSALHTAWLEQYSSSLRTDIRYTPGNAYDTFPMCRAMTQLEEPATWYYEHRRQIMLARQEGLTKTYNRFHDSDETSPDIQKLRQLHAEMDHAVAAAYGWTDLDLGHGFHQTKQGLRFTISEAARREVLARLLKLNHERYAEEDAKGLHDKKRAKATKRRKAPSASEASLYGGEE
jgi:hypothetical protein